MNAVGNIPQLSVPVMPKASSGPAQPAPQAPLGKPQAETLDTRAMDRQRLASVERAARDIANPFVVSNRTFTIFKDTTGQFVTRFRDLQTGKVTYVPEPELMKRSSSSNPMLNIKA